MALKYEMISALDKKRMGQITNWTHLWGGSQFIWDSKDNRLKVTSSFFGFFKFLLLVYGGFVYGVYLTWRCLESKNSGKPVVEYSMCILLLAIAAILGILCHAFILKENDILLFINSVLKSSEWFANKYGTNKAHKKPKLVKWISRLLRILAFLFRFYGFLTGLISLILPYEIIFPASLFPIKYRSIWLALFQGGFVIWGTFAACGMLCSTVTWLLVLAISFIQTQTEVNLNKGNYWTKPALRKPASLKRIVALIRIIWQLFENFLRSLIMPAQMVLTRTVHFSNYMLIRHHDQIPWLYLLFCVAVSITITVVWVGMMHCAALIHKTAASNRVTFKNCPIANKLDRIVWKKFVRSMKPVGIMAGDFYMIQNNTVITIASIFFHGTMRTLLAFKKFGEPGH